MKTLLTTIAVLFTMATAVTAGSALDRLANETTKYKELQSCTLQATLEGLKDKTGYSREQIYNTLMKPENRNSLEKVVKGSKTEARLIKDLRNLGYDENTVSEQVKGNNFVFGMYITQCVTKHHK